MDTKTRAEKIVREMVLESRQDRFSKATIREKHLVAFIASQLDEAMREAVKGVNYIDMTPATQFVYGMAFHAAKEKAAGIARKGIADHMSGKPSQIISDIEAMEADK